MGRAAEGLRAVVPRAAADAAGLHVCRGRLRRGRCDRGLYQRRADREIRSGGAGRSEARDPALRRNCAGRAETRFRSGIAGGAAAAAGPDRYIRYARGQSARRRWRRRVVFGYGRPLAVGQGREALGVTGWNLRCLTSALPLRDELAAAEAAYMATKKLSPESHAAHS